MNRNVFAGLAAVLVAVGGYVFWPTPVPVIVVDKPVDDDAIVSVILPEHLSATDQLGERAYEATCAACHGENGVGRDGRGPPLVHKIYEPSHHGDFAFERAVQLGVRSHHWPFGDMPPQTDVTIADVKAIVSYVRTLQRANGIE